MNVAHTVVREYGEYVAVICGTCNYREEFELIRQANAATRSHNYAFHRQEP